MEKKIERWEKKYQNFESQRKDLEENYNKLKSKLDNKTISKEEYQEFKRLEKSLEKSDKVKANLPKVANLIEYKNNMESLKAEIMSEMQSRKNWEKSDKENETERIKIDKQLSKIMQERESLISQLKNPSLSDKEKNSIESKINGLEAQNNDNQKRYKSNIEARKKLDEQKEEQNNNEYAGLSSKELMNMAIKINVKISICNFYATRLMNGQSLDSVKTEETELDIDKKDIEKRTKKEFANKEWKLPKSENEKMQKIKDSVKDENEEEKENITESKADNDGQQHIENENNEKNDQSSRIVQSESEEEKQDEEELAMEGVSEFDQKHPILVKAKNLFKKLKNFIQGKISGKEEESIEEPEKVSEEPEKVSEEPEKVSEEPEKETKHTKFIDKYKVMENLNISEVAENGLEDAVDKDQHKSKQEKIKKLIENKRNAAGDVDIASIKKLEAQLDDEER